MNVVDANVLLYAVNADVARHDEARTWLDTALRGGAPVGFSWIVLLAFVRLVTKRGVFPNPLDASVAVDVIEAWLAQPAATVLEPTSAHVAVLRSLLDDAHATGNLVNDAHLAALAIEHRGRVISYDADFGRFAGVTWRTPADA